jgi:hypothetical protein
VSVQHFANVSYCQGVTNDPQDYKKNLVKLWSSSYINQTTQIPSPVQDNADAVVLTISPNRAASLIGIGPAGAPLQPELGCTDFRLYNVDVANRATVNGKEFFGQTGPSAAILLAYSRVSTYGSTFFSYQDTLFAGRNSSLFSYGEPDITRRWRSLLIFLRVQVARSEAGLITFMGLEPRGKPLYRTV